MIKTRQMRDDKDSDLIFCTVGMYKLFLSQNNGLEAFQLYMHLMFTARLQETNQVRANNYYLKRGLNWGEAKVKRAKSYIKLSKVWSRETLIRKLSTSSKATGSKSHPVAIKHKCLKLKSTNSLSKEIKRLK